MEVQGVATTTIIITQIPGEITLTLVSITGTSGSGTPKTDHLLTTGYTARQMGISHDRGWGNYTRRFLITNRFI